MRPKWYGWWRLTALAFDFVAVGIALAGAAVLRFGPFEALELAGPQISSLSAPWLLAVPIWLAAFASFGLYNPVRWANAVEEAQRIAAAGMAAPIAFVVLAFFTRQTPSRFWLIAGGSLCIGTVSTGRRSLRWVRNRVRLAGGWLTPTIVVGRFEAKRVIDELVSDPTTGYMPVATCGFAWNGLDRGELEELGDLVHRKHAGAVLVVSDDLDHEEVQRAVAVADKEPATVVVLPGLDYTLAHSLHVVPVGREPGLALEAPSLKPHQSAMKRAVDICLSGAALIVLSPFLALVALAVKIDSRGRVLFGQQRVGRDGGSFTVFKFRTMIEGAHEQRRELDAWNESDGLLFKIRDDPRLTRVGRYLRRWSIDEVPQLLNVIVGDMSLVGPRPLPTEDYELPGAEMAMRRRLRVRPGITGLWQVNGRSDLSSEELVRFDVTYVQNWSLLLDFYLMLRTMPAVLSGRGAF